MLSVKLSKPTKDVTILNLQYLFQVSFGDYQKVKLPQMQLKGIKEGDAEFPQRPRRVEKTVLSLNVHRIRQ